MLLAQGRAMLTGSCRAMPQGLGRAARPLLAPPKPRLQSSRVVQAVKKAGAASPSVRKHTMPGSPALRAADDPLFLTGPQALFLCTFGGALGAIASRRTVFHALLHPLLARLPAWLVPAATAAAVYLREALIYCTAAGVALVASWAIWKLVEAREALQPAEPRLLPPSPGVNEAEAVKQLRFELYKARQEASDAKHALKVLHHSQQQSGVRGAAGEAQAAELARQLERRGNEVRMVRMEAHSAKQELERARNEAKELSGIVTATLESLATVDVEEGSAGAGEPATAEGAGGLLAAAAALRSKVALLSTRAREGAAGLAQVRQLEQQVRGAGAAIQGLNQQLALARSDSEAAQKEVAALRDRLKASERENNEMAAAACKAVRHLDSYDKMVIRLEDMVEALEADKLALQAQLDTLTGANSNGAKGAEGRRPQHVNGARPAAA